MIASGKEPTDRDPESAETRGLLCVECRCLNGPERRTCHACKADLFRECSLCGQENQRASGWCQYCGARLTGGRAMRAKPKQRRLPAWRKRTMLVCFILAASLLALAVFGVLVYVTDQF